MVACGCILDNSAYTVQNDYGQLSQILEFTVIYFVTHIVIQEEAEHLQVLVYYLH